MRKRINKILWHGDELLEEKAKAPGIATSADGLDGLNEGEIYISNNEKDPALFIRTSSGKVVRVGVNYEELKKLFLSRTDDDTAEGLINFEKGVRIKNLILKVENDVLSLTNIENGKRAHFAASGTVSSLGVGSTGGGGGSSEGGASALYQLLDVLSDGTKVEGAEDGSVLTYDENAGKWKATKIDIPEADLTEIEGQLESIGKLITALQGKDTEHSNAITALQKKDGEHDAAIGSNTKGIESIQKQLDTLVSGDASDAIDTFNEVVAFLKDIEDDSTLEGILAGKQNKITETNKLDYSLLANTPSLADFMGGSAIGGTASSDNFSAVYWDGKQWQTRTIYKWALASAKPSYTTSEVTEGTRLYFTDDRAKDALKKTTDDLSARITVFEKMFQWGNGEGSYVKTPFPLASDSTVSSLGIGSEGNGGVSYDRLDSWDNYDAGAGAVLSATLGYELKQAIENIDLGDFNLTAYLTKEEASKTYATINSFSGYQKQLNALSERIKAYEDILKIENGGKLLHSTVAFASDSTVSSLGVGSDEGSDIGGIIDLTNVVSNIIPSLGNSYTIGDENTLWKAVYATELYTGNIAVGSAIASLQNNLGTATGNIQGLTSALSSVISRVGNIETNYLPRSGGELQGVLTINPTNVSGGQDGIILHDSGAGDNENLRIKWTSTKYTTGIDISPNSNYSNLTFYDGTTRHDLIHSGNIGSQSVASAQSLTHSNGTLGATVSSNGNVLIGTTTDNGAKLQVNGIGRFETQSGNLLLLEPATNGLDGSGIAFWSSGVWKKGTINASTLYLNSSSEGNVLIGTTTDSGYKLYVNGDSYVNGSLTVSNSVTIGDAKIWWDATNKVLRTDKSFASDKTVSSLGVGSESGGGGTGGYASLDNVASDVLPSASNTFTIGNSSRLWKAIYANNLYLGTTNVGESLSSLQSGLSTVNGNIGTLNTRVTNIEGGYLPLSGGTMDRNTGIAWNNGYYDSDAVGSHLSVLADTTQDNSLATQTGWGYNSVLNVGGGGIDSYRFQLASYAGGGNILFYRGYNGNSNIWADWVSIIHSGNIGSQSVNYANSAGYTSFYAITTNSGQVMDANLLHGGMFANYYGYDKWKNAPSGMSYGSILSLTGSGYKDLSGQLAWDVNHNGADSTRFLWWRANNYTNFANAKWHQIAFTDSNVASADKLSTARTIWGQSFDGSGDVSGTLTSVGNIQFLRDNAYVIGEATKQALFVFAGWFGSGNGKPLTFGANNWYCMYVNTSNNITIGPTHGSNDLATTNYKLYVNGNSYVNGTLTVSSAAKVNSLNVNDKASITNTGAINGTSLVMAGGNIQLYKNDDSAADYFTIDNAGNTYIGGTLGVDGAAIFGSTLKVTGTTTLEDKLTISKNGMSVSGAAYFGGGTTYYFGSTGNVSANTLTAAGATSLKSTLAVTGATTLSSTLGVTGVATFNSNIKAKGYIYFGANDDAYIYWDATNKVLRTNVSFASDKTVSSLGVGSESGGGGSADWGAVPTSIIPTVNGEYNLGSNAKMWNALYVQSGYFGGFLVSSNDITIQKPMLGSGSTWQIATNGAASFSSLNVGGSAINFGNFATTSQLNSYVTLKSQQTIEGAKTFQNGLNFYGELKGYDAESGGDNIVLNASDGSVNLSTLTAGTAIYTGEKTAAWDGKSGTAIMASGSMVLCAAAPRIYFAYGNAASSAGVASLEAMSGSGLNFKYNMQVFTESESYANFIGLNFKNTRIFRLNNSSSGMQFQYGTSASSVSTKGTFSTSGAYSASSDITKKNILSYNAGFNVRNIAEAPIAYFTWKDLTDNRVNLGSIAQYWQLIAPECIYGKEGIDMTMDYSTLGLVSSIINARAIVSHENEIDKLKRRVEELENENKRLQERVDALVA